MSRSYSAEIAKLAKLETFDARAFIGDNKAAQDCADFVLALAVVFNDIKDLLLADHLLLGEAPEDQVSPTRELGAFAGLHMHFFRVLLGVLYELLYLVEKHAAAQHHPNFELVVKNLPPLNRRAWQKIVAASKAKTSSDPDVSFLVVARNTVAYHYDPKSIGRGYRTAFAAGESESFISRGSTIGSTRFYFADRATQTHLRSAFDDKEVVEYFLERAKVPHRCRRNRVPDRDAIRHFARVSMAAGRLTSR